MAKVKSKIKRPESEKIESFSINKIEFYILFILISILFIMTFVLMIKNNNY